MAAATFPRTAFHAARPSAKAAVLIQTRQANPAVRQLALDRGLSERCALLLASRIDETDRAARLLSASLNSLDHPEGLPDIAIATDRILEALAKAEVCDLSTDHDADGQSGAAILHRCMVALGHPVDKLLFHISHRLTEGYGLNDSVADRILASDPRPTLVITADNGSSDQPRIARLRAAGVDVIVTDHHTIPLDGPPHSALACVNPIRPGFSYPDSTVCGAMVAWLLMANVRRVGIERGQFPASTPKFSPLLAIASIATVADCVSMASPNNRAVVRGGLQLLRSSSEPFCQAIRQRLGGPGHPITEETIGFQIAPRLAAHGRLDEAMPGIRFLGSSTLDQALSLFDILTEANDERKSIQRDLTDRAMFVAEQIVAAGVRGVAIHLADGMAGVHGITSSRITETYGLPSAMMSPVVGKPDLVAVSMRSIPGIHLKDVLDEMRSIAPSLLVAGGGHAAAAGAKVRLLDVELFQSLFDQCVKRRAPELQPARRFLVDGDLTGDMLTPEAYDDMASLSPFGRGFEPPLFKAVFRVREPRLVGKEGLHLQFRATLADGTSAKAIWFSAVPSPGAGSPLRDGDVAEGVFRLSDNVWNGRRRIELQCQHAGLADEGRS